MNISPVVTVQCTRDGQFVVVVAKAATIPQLNLDTVILLDGEEDACAPVNSTEAYVIFQFSVRACGTSVKVGMCTTCIPPPPFAFG